MKFTKETFKRMFRTFIQAAVAYLAVNIATVDFTAEGAVLKSAITGLITATIAAGIAAVMNLHKNEIQGTIYELVEEDEFITEDENAE